MPNSSPLRGTLAQYYSRIMPTRKYRMVNPDSGEVFDVHELPDEESAGKPAKQRPTHHDERWLTVFLHGARWAIGQTHLSGTDFRVLFANWLLPGDEETGWHVDHKKIARMCQVSEAQVLKSTARLIRAGLLIKPQRGYLAHHPLFSWRGTAVARAAAKQAYLDRAKTDD